MVKRSYKLGVWVIAVAIICVLVANLLPSSSARATQLALPPRPTPTTTLKPPKSAPDGGVIELYIKFDQAIVPTQALWSIVQWQDSLGMWHDVDGWQGTPDAIITGGATKTWWVNKTDLGKGPFRWVIYAADKNKWLAESPSFYLPKTPGQKVEIVVSLAP